MRNEDTTDPQQQQLDNALNALERDTRNAAAAIRTMPPGRGAFDAATRLTDRLRELSEIGPALRIEQAQRIRHLENLTLRALAERLGISVTRAHQLTSKSIDRLHEITDPIERAKAALLLGEYLQTDTQTDIRQIRRQAVDELRQQGLTYEQIGKLITDKDGNPLSARRVREIHNADT